MGSPALLQTFCHADLAPPVPGCLEKKGDRNEPPCFLQSKADLLTGNDGYAMMENGSQN